MDLEKEGKGKEMGEFTHFDQQGNARMVDVGGKPDTEREACARGSIWMSAECLAKIKAKNMKKGDVLGAAQIAGIMAAKRTWETIPLCHLIQLTSVTLEFSILEEKGEIQAFCRTKTRGKTGVEMEALMGVSAALLTIYDMCKAVDRGMVMGEIRLDYKAGGKSGEFVHPHGDCGPYSGKGQCQDD